MDESQVTTDRRPPIAQLSATFAPFGTAPAQRLTPIWAFLPAIGLMLFAVYLLWSLTAPAFWLLIAGLGWGNDPAEWRVATTFDTVFFGLCIVVVRYWWRWVERRGGDTVGLGPRPDARGSLAWAGVGFAWAALSWAVGSALDPGSDIGWAEGLRIFTRPDAAILSLLIIVPLIVVGAAAEEIVYRGWMLSTLGPKLGIGWAVAISSALFAATHLTPSEYGTAEGLLTFATYVAAGAGFAFIALRQGHLYGAIAFHTGYNVLLFWQGYGAYGFDPGRTYDELMAASRVIDHLPSAAAFLLLELALTLHLLRRWTGEPRY